MADFVMDGKIGVDLTAIWASASTSSSIQLPFAPGTRVSLSNNGVAVFVRAQSTIAQYDCVIMATYGDSASTTPILRACPIDTTNVAALGRGPVGFAQTAITSAYYGWVHMSGVVTVSLASACQPNVMLFTTGTGGVLDDATVSAGYIAGLVATTSATSGTDNIVCLANNTVAILSIVQA